MDGEISLNLSFHSTPFYAQACWSREIRSIAGVDVESTSENTHFLKSRRGSRMNPRTRNLLEIDPNWRQSARNIGCYLPRADFRTQ